MSKNKHKTPRPSAEEVKEDLKEAMGEEGAKEAAEEEALRAEPIQKDSNLSYDELKKYAQDLGAENDKAKREIEELRKADEEMKAELSKLRDERLREAAETENFKKRLNEQKIKDVQYANEKIINDLLEPLSNFALAIKYQDQSDIEGYRKGVMLIEEQMMSMLESKYGLSTIGREGEDYDPNTMEAVQAIEKDGIDGEKVDHVLSLGYKLHDKVIKIAKVVVAKPKAKE